MNLKTTVAFLTYELRSAVRVCMLGIYSISYATTSMWSYCIESYLFSVPDLCSVCVHDQQLLVTLPGGEANLLHPTTMCWYPPKNVN